MPRRFSAAKFKKQRLQAGLSLEQVAVAIDRSWASVYGYERGRSVPSVDALVSLGDALGCDLDSFLEPHVGEGVSS
ncbi:MAG: helix-turn-helix transcriptional regulator [Gaiellaceae bacterium]